MVVLPKPSEKKQQPIHPFLGEEKGNSKMDVKRLLYPSILKTNCFGVITF